MTKRPGYYVPLPPLPGTPAATPAASLFDDIPAPASPAAAAETLLAALAAAGIRPTAERFEAAVDAEVERLRVRRRAAEILEAELRGPMPAFDAGTLAEILGRPPEPPMRVEGFLPSGGRLLLVAQRKTGKTTLDLNLALSLIDGGHFLGRFPTRAVTGNVGILNYELTPAMLAGWAQQVGIPPERLLLVNLRGRRNPLRHPEDRAHLVELLRRHHIEVMLVDPFGRAYTGKSQNDAGEVTAWLGELDQFATDAGVSELVLSVHAGWNGERTRGTSALEDWADVIATLTRDPDDDRLRYLSAFGRDVEVDEDRLQFEPATRTLTLTGAGSRKRDRMQRAVEAVLPDVLAFVTENPDCSGEDIRKGVDGNDTVIARARDQLVDRGELLPALRGGRGGGKSYRVKEPLPTPAEPLPAGVETPATPAIEAGVQQQEFPTDPSSRGSEAKSACAVADCAQPISADRRAAGYRTCAAHYLEEP